MSRENDQTQVGPRPEQPRLPQREQQVFLRRVGALYEQVERPESPGFLLFWGRDGDLSWRHVPAHDGEHLIAGRHTRCQVRLADDQEISLRHLLLSSHLLDDGAVTLRLLNLRAPLPFFLDDDTPHWSLATTGPLMLRLGSYHLLALPSGEGPGGMANRRFREMPSYVKQPSEAPEAPRPSARYGDSDDGPTSVTIAPPISVLSSLPSAPPRDAYGRLLVESKGSGVIMGLLERDLRLGVLVGRSPKCHDPRLVDLLSLNISRAHLLLLLEGDRVCAYDLASTNGTRVDGQSQRFAVLDDRASLVLGQGEVLRIRWELRPDPL